MRDEWIKKCAGLALLVIAAFVAYYFFIALPRHNAAILEIEREKLVATERERQAKAAAEQKAHEEEQKAHDEANMRAALNQRLFSICSDEAVESYWSYVKLNGQLVSGTSDTYSATQYVWNNAERRKKEQLDACYRRYKP
jgi:hypothetical protein